MATIVENLNGRRIIRVSTDDVISLVKEYQNIVCNTQSYDEIRQKLDKTLFYIPEDV